MKKITLAASLASFLILGAAARADDAAANWTKNCAACHASDGTGHTKAGRMARVKNMTDPNYQKTFTDEQAATQIKSGFTDKTGKERMKAFGDKFSNDEVNALVRYVRSFQK
jgi:cytochrome c553